MLAGNASFASLEYSRPASAKRRGACSVKGGTTSARGVAKEGWFNTRPLTEGCQVDGAHQDAKNATKKHARIVIDLPIAKHGVGTPEKLGRDDEGGTEGDRVDEGHCPAEVGGAVLGSLDHRDAVDLLEGHDVPHEEGDANAHLRNEHVERHCIRAGAAVGAGGRRVKGGLDENGHLEQIDGERDTGVSLVAHAREEGGHDHEENDNATRLCKPLSAHVKDREVAQGRFRAVEDLGVRDHADREEAVHGHGEVDEVGEEVSHLCCGLRRYPIAMIVHNFGGSATTCVRLTNLNMKSGYRPFPFGRVERLESRLLDLEKLLLRT